MQLPTIEIENIIESKINSGVEKYGNEFKTLIIEILALEKMIAPSTNVQNQSRLIPLSKWNDYHEVPAVGTLRQWAFHNQEFKEACIVKQGARVMIDEDKYFRYMESTGL